MDEHRELQIAALRAEGRGAEALMIGRADEAASAYAEAADLYRRSYEAAPPDAYGRLVGMVKAAVLAGSGEAEAARYMGRRGQSPESRSPVAAYALALAALVDGDDGAAREAAAAMREGGEGFASAAEAIDALARGDGDAYADAVRAIVADFEGREHYVAKVPIADTALVLERLAEPRGLAARPASPLLP